MSALSEKKRREFSSLNEDDWKRRANEDDEAIMQILSGSQQGTESGSLPADLMNMQFSQEGKAADAEDFEDISDDDLPEEEAATGGADASATPFAMDMPGLTDDAGTSNDTDDLFGDQPSSPTGGNGGGLFRASPGPDEAEGDAQKTSAIGEDFDNDDGGEGDNNLLRNRAADDGLSSALGDAADAAAHKNDPFVVTDSDRALNFPEDYGHDDNQDPNIPPVAENLVDLVRLAFPSFEKGKILNFNEQLAPKPLHLTEKKPPKPPKPLMPAKLSLEFEVDQEKLFRIPGPAQPTRRQRIRDEAAKGLVSCLEPEPVVVDNGNIFGDLLGDGGGEDGSGGGDDDDDASVGGFTLKDFSIICADWDDIIGLPSPPASPGDGRGGGGALVIKSQRKRTKTGDGRYADSEQDAWEREILGSAPPPKRRKVIVEHGLPALPRYVAPSFDSFEEATARAAKRVYLDMTDHRLLLDDNDTQRDAKRTKTLAAGGGRGGGGGDGEAGEAGDGTAGAAGAAAGAAGAGSSSQLQTQAGQKRTASGGRLARNLLSRFNYANDQAYEQLKENHQNRVRAQLSSVQVEHSLPALKLLWPYYAITRYGPEPHDYHRPQLKVSKGIGFTVRFSRLHKVAKREWKLKKIPEVFARSKDLSLGDNATAVLFEYSEEIPTVLSNFGMGNKVINYYRRKSKGDEEKPAKPELGEVSFLLPEDKSPFSNFGTVEPGETVPTLHNPMFHAPIFRHQARATDFLMGRTHTSQEGTAYYLRKMDHLYVVGQTFPLAEVPGPHSRKVTALSKNRLKMVAYRLIYRNGSVSLSDITAHVRDSNDTQNRQKLKEFLHYNKETKTWGMRANEPVLDPATINSMIKPDEVCLHDAMQVGQNELSQNGYQLDDSAALDDIDDENDKESIANNMVPWKTTKSFMDACAGKAMLQLHGAGDPTGRGLGFSFIRTSMKGGFMGAIQGPAATSADAMERERKANNGHLYNVKKQDALYNNAIRKIWTSQRTTLEDETPHDDEDVQPQDDEDDRFNGGGGDAAGGGGAALGLGPAAAAATPSIATTPVPPASAVTGGFRSSVAAANHLGEDGVSQMSRPSMSNAPEKRKLRITRTYRDEKTGQVHTKTEVVHDPGVISQYMRQRASLDMEKIDPYSVKPTGNLDYDRVLMQRLESEEARLNRNKERRHAREKQKALQQQIHDGDPDSPAPSIERGSTTRKCANCGQQGHIKTNKKLCPMLNGTYKSDKGMEEDAFGVYNAME